jgi:hypothetical protein
VIQALSADEQRRRVSTLTQFLQFGAYLVAWLLLSVPGIWFFLSLRDSLFQISVLLQLNPWAVRGIDRWGIFVFGMVWIVAIFSIEGYFRTAIAKNRLWKRIRRVFVWELIFAAVLLLIQWMIHLIS